jgi:hypothetical protein
MTVRLILECALEILGWYRVKRWWFRVNYANRN